MVVRNKHLFLQSLKNAGTGYNGGPGQTQDKSPPKEGSTRHSGAGKHTKNHREGDSKSHRQKKLESEEPMAKRRGCGLLTNRRTKKKADTNYPVYNEERGAGQRRKHNRGKLDKRPPKPNTKGMRNIEMRKRRKIVRGTAGFQKPEREGRAKGGGQAPPQLQEK